MKWTDKFKHKYRGFGVDNLMLYILVPMAFVYVIQHLLNMPIIEHLMFSRTAILSGQVWRLVTFAFIPSTDNILFFIISLSFYYFIGKSLENHWGKELFNLYYLIGLVMTMLSGFILGSTTNEYLNLSLFLAFALLYPDMQLLIYGIIPVKAKYLAMLDGVFYLISLVTNIIAMRFSVVIAIIVSLINVAIFFGPSFFDDMKRRKEIKRRRREYEQSFRNNK